MDTYMIIRYYADENHPDNFKVIERDLTLEEAREHCQRPDTQGDGWFDGYADQDGYYDGGKP